MALLVPFSYTLTQGWGPTIHAIEPAGYGQGQRFWWNPVSGFRFYSHFHPGRDLAAPEGTPILASEAGTVSAAGWNGVSGLRIHITIRPGTMYVHGHLSRLGPGISLGDHVARGQVIGYVGQSGGATGPHSHFAVLSTVPGTHQSMIYDPALFWAGGANQNDPRILPLGSVPPPTPPPPTPTPTPTPPPPVSGYPRTLNFAAGTYVGHKFSSEGATVATKPYTLTKSSSAPASQRSLIKNQSGYWYFITAGIWAGYWIKESAGIT